MRKHKPRMLIGGLAAAVLLCACIVWFATRKYHHSSSGISPQYTVILDNLYPFIHSPNFNDRPDGEIVNCIVLHATGENTRKGVVQGFLDSHEHRSAHFVVSRDGSVIQMVPVEMRAWHAGTSSLDGVAGVNDYSIGIEMVNRNNGREPYTPAQYMAVAKLIDQIRAIYPVPQNRIVSHADIALPLGRKSDPEGFNFPRLFNKMNQLEPDVQSQMAFKIVSAHHVQKIARAEP